MEKEELTVAAFDPTCSRLDILNGLGVRFGSPKPPLATELLNTSLSINMMICRKPRA